jgi:uncharacterized protein YcbK (DUF882 family)
LLRLLGVAVTQFITPHFRWHEFTCHDGTAPPAAARPAISYLCQFVLEPMRRDFGPITIVSGYRTPSWNKHVHGAKDSRHVYDDHPDEPAVDIRCRAGSPADWYQWLDAHVGGGLGRYAHHVHLDLRHRRTRWTD